MEFINILKRILKCSDFIIVRKRDKKLSVISTISPDETIDYLNIAITLTEHNKLYHICKN